MNTKENTSQRLARIEIAKQAMNFSAGHFTIFSATNRENLHGHNFSVECDLTAPIGSDGLMFDYGVIKSAVKDLCDELDELVLLPELSPYLSLSQENGYLVASYADEKLMFLPRDVKTLPIANTTVEELSQYLLGRLLAHQNFTNRGIVAMTVKVASSPGQKGVATWALN